MATGEQQKNRAGSTTEKKSAAMERKMKKVLDKNLKQV